MIVFADYSAPITDKILIQDTGLHLLFERLRRMRWYYTIRERPLEVKNKLSLMPLGVCFDTQDTLYADLKQTVIWYVIQ